MSGAGAKATPFYHFYRLVAECAAPLIWRRVNGKLGHEGIPEERRKERLGHATADRPDGMLLWFHAASVGESVSVLALVQELLDTLPQASALITSGTAASAKVLANRLPARCQHQFAPIDSAAPLRRFFDHWRPDAGVFVESEIWPQLLVRARARGIPLALVNARMSRTTLRNWQRLEATFRFLMDQFAVIRTQDRATLDGVLALGADPEQVDVGPNLKALIQAPPVDEQALEEMRIAYPGPVWSAVSTHEGEEEAVLDAHLLAARRIEGLRLILVPRHPTRADGITRLIAEKGLSVARRSAGEAPGSAEVYLADTLGETGLWYALSPVTFLGGSFGPAGGHTPFEPACFGTPILHGLKVSNFAEAYALFDSSGAAKSVADAEALAQALHDILTDPAMHDRMATAARRIRERQRGEIAAIARLLQEKLLPATLGKG